MSKTEDSNVTDLVVKARAAAEKFRDPSKRKQKAEEPTVEASEAVAAEAEVPKDVTLFVSRDHEPSRFDVDLGGEIIRGGPSRFDPRIMEWRVPNALVERFRRHHHVITQRIVEAK